MKIASLTGLLFALTLLAEPIPSFGQQVNQNGKTCWVVIPPNQTEIFDPNTGKSYFIGPGKPLPNGYKLVKWPKTPENPFVTYPPGHEPRAWVNKKTGEAGWFQFPTAPKPPSDWIRLIPSFPNEQPAGSVQPVKCRETHRKPLKTIGSSLREITPQPGMDTAQNEEAVLSPIAPAGGEVFATFVDKRRTANNQEQTGISGFVVHVVTPNGHDQYLQGSTDSGGHLAFAIPAAAAAIEIGRGFDSAGKFQAAAHLDVTTPNAHVAGTQPVEGHIPSGNAPSISEINAATNMTSQGARVTLHTNNLDPTNTQVLVRGQRGQADLLAASETSAVIQIRPQVDLGSANIALISNGMQTNTAPLDIVRITAQEPPPSETGVVETMTFTIEGIPPTQTGTLRLTAVSPTIFADGRTTADVPIINGHATVSIRGQRPGVGGIRYELIVTKQP